MALDWENSYRLYVADQIEAEIEDVFHRPKIRAKFSQLTDVRIQTVMDVIRNRATRVTVNDVDIEPICRDPKDDIFLACAKIGQADYLVTEDQDLLVLKQHDKTQIINVSAFLSVLESKRQE